MDAAAFWTEVRKRKNQFFLAAPSWLVIGPALLAVLPTNLLSGYVVIFTWMGLMWWLQERVTELRCFHCGKQAFGNAFFFMRHAKCRNCGIAYVST